jgi:hypothetical protein
VEAHRFPRWQGRTRERVFATGIEKQTSLEHVRRESVMQVSGLLKKKLTVGVTPLLGIATLVIVLFVYSWDGRKPRWENDGRDSGLGVYGLVRKVREELTRAENEMVKNNEQEMFVLKDLELEISFVVKKTVMEKGTVEYSFVTVEGESQTGVEKVQKLRLQWSATTPTKGSAAPSSGPLQVGSGLILTPDKKPPTKEENR